MMIDAVTDADSAADTARAIHPVWLRVTHWINAVVMHVTDDDRGGFWENQGYNRFSGL